MPFTGWEAKGIRSEVILKKRRPWSMLNLRVLERQARFSLTVERNRSGLHDRSLKVRAEVHPIPRFTQG